MAFFPVVNSNLSPKHLALLLQEKYTLSSYATCRLLKAGINDTYLVNDLTKKYVFRVYSFNWRSKEEIAEEIRLLDLLKENAISISFALPDSENNYIQTLNAPEGDRFAVLFTFAEGEKLHVVSKETQFKIGELMARMHQVTGGQVLNRMHYTPEVILNDSLQKLRPFISADTDEMNFMSNAKNYLLQQLKQVDTSQLRTGMVHLDIWFDNLNITKDNLVTVFDFDFCGNGWLCLDLAYYILQLHNIEKYEAEAYRPKVESFMNGYESVTSISAEEKRLIPMLGTSLYFFYLGIQCQRFDNWSNTFLNENYLKRYINGLVKRYFEIYYPGKIADGAF